MRKDMNKVLTKRPRVGGKGPQRKTYDQLNRCREKRFYKGVEVDTRPKQESMRRRHVVGGDWKEFSDLIGPLERFLISRVGRPWDKVWSEICQVLKGNGLQAAHLKGHVKQMVDGIPHSGETFFREEDWFKPHWGAVYVDEHGILRKNPKR